jgi:flavin reductase (DIM6/NTAB) family NADH-FMN oxidoreductase RutF
MKLIDPLELAVPKLQRLLQSIIAPRPIALASTIDKKNNPNLSPFSFFNLFGVNPTTIIFSPSRRGRDNTTKDTFNNLKEVPEVVINAVTYPMVHQTSLASTEYPKGVDEFIKAGFTPLPSEKIKPFRVKESPVQFECSVRQIVETGDQEGAGNLVICQILLIHLNESILNDNGIVDPNKIDLIGRMGDDYYCRASGNALFEVEKPLLKTGIGIDQLPKRIKNSKFLSGNDLGKLGNLESLPDKKDIADFLKISGLKAKYHTPAAEAEKMIFAEAKELIDDNKTGDALKLLIGMLCLD